MPQICLMEIVHGAEIMDIGFATATNTQHISKKVASQRAAQSIGVQKDMEKEARGKGKEDII